MDVGGRITSGTVIETTLFDQKGQTRLKTMTPAETREKCLETVRC
jgi:hypothetical protein